jgi:hypothetical protein
MRTYSVALHLLLQAQYRPETAVADALHGILTADKRKHAGNQSALIDGAIAGDDIASSIDAVSLADDDMPDESVFAV